MRTSTVVCLTALGAVALAAPSAVVAHEVLDALAHDGSWAFGTHQSQNPWQNEPTGNSTADDSTTGTGTSTRADVRQQRGVVMIDTIMPPQGEGAGSGMVLSSDGVVLTNYHVVNGSSQIRVTVPNGRSYTADVVGHDQSHDVAVLKLRGASGLSTVSLDTDGVRMAESVLAVGQGEGEGVLFAAKGKVTGLNAEITATDDTSLASSETLTGLIQTNAPIVPGYSGGPLFDAAGKVVGIDTAAAESNSLTGYSKGGSSPAEGFAIPITQAKSIADDILKGQRTATNHLGARASLGISVKPTRSGQPGSGVVVHAALDGGGADTAGIEAGDIITSVDGHPTRTTSDLSHVMDREAPGARIKVTWTDAAGAQHSGTVMLDTSPEN